MNNRGQIYLGIIFAFFLFVMGVMFLPLHKDSVDSVRNDLNCTNYTGISSGTMVTCLETDAATPYFIWLVISIAISFIVGRLR